MVINQEVLGIKLQKTVLATMVLEISSAVSCVTYTLVPAFLPHIANSVFGTDKSCIILPHIIIYM
jgi:hypothetical protein